MTLPRDEGLFRLLEGMTEAQRFAFAHPAVDVRAAQDGRFSRLVDDKPGDTAWRVVLIVDATGGPEGWPCWHCTAVYGELRKGIARPAEPMFRERVPGNPAAGWAVNWPNMRFRLAEAIIRRELAGVGMRDTLEVASRDELMAEGMGNGTPPSELVGLSGRVRLTMYEAQACLPRPWLERYTHLRGNL